TPAGSPTAPAGTPPATAPAAGSPSSRHSTSEALLLVLGSVTPPIGAETDLPGPVQVVSRLPAGGYAALFLVGMALIAAPSSRCSVPNRGRGRRRPPGRRRVPRGVALRRAAARAGRLTRTRTRDGPLWQLA